MDRAWTAALGLSALVACGPRPDSPDLMAVVDGARLTAADLRRFEQSLATGSAVSGPPPDDHRANLQTLIDRKLLIREATRRDLAADDKVRARLARREDEHQRGLMIDLEVRQRFSLGEEEVRAEFDDGGWNEEVTTEEIFLVDEDRARQVYRTLQEGADFAQVARHESVDRMLKLPLGTTQVYRYTRQDAPQAVVAAVFPLPQGGISPPVRVQDGWVIARVRSRRPLTLEEVRPKLVTHLTQKKKTALRDIYYIGLKERYGLTFHADGMAAAVAALGARQRPPAATAALPVYSYDGGTLDAGEVWDLLAAPSRSWTAVDGDRVGGFLRDSVLPDTLTLVDARRRGATQAEAYQKWVTGNLEDLMILRLRERVLEERVQLTQPLLEQVYERDRWRFRSPAHWHVRDLLVAERATADSLWQVLQQGADFEALVGRHTVRQGDPVLSVFQGQERPYTREWVEAVERAPFGALQGPVRTTSGWSIFRIEGDNAEEVFPLSDRRVRGVVEQQAREDEEARVFNDYLRDLRQQSADLVTVYDGNLRRYERGEAQ